MYCKTQTKPKEMEFMLTKIKYVKSHDTAENPPAKCPLEWWKKLALKCMYNLTQWYSCASCCMIANLLRLLLSRDWNTFSITKKPDDACWPHAFTFSTPYFQAKLIVKVRSNGEVTTLMGCWSLLLWFQTKVLMWSFLQGFLF